LINGFAAIRSAVATSRDDAIKPHVSPDCTVYVLPPPPPPLPPDDIVAVAPVGADTPFSRIKKTWAVEIGVELGTVLGSVKLMLPGAWLSPSPPPPLQATSKPPTTSNSVRTT
jgi:hypothetical protein